MQPAPLRTLSAHVYTKFAGGKAAMSESVTRMFAKWQEKGVSFVNAKGEVTSGTTPDSVVRVMEGPNGERFTIAGLASVAPKYLLLRFPNKAGIAFGDSVSAEFVAAMTTTDSFYSFLRHLANEALQQNAVVLAEEALRVRPHMPF